MTSQEILSIVRDVVGRHLIPVNAELCGVANGNAIIDLSSGVTLIDFNEIARRVEDEFVYVTSPYKSGDALSLFITCTDV